MMSFFFLQTLDAIVRLKQLLWEIGEKLQKPVVTEEPDPEWLAGTEVEKYEKVQLTEIFIE